MNNLIYYPSFEPRDQNWLKYALIYIDRFSPIIPESGVVTLSDHYKSIIQETDLIRIHNPTYRQGDRAVTNALREMDFIERTPELYRDKFNDVNVIRTWQNQANWKFEIYGEKFTEPFEYECVKRGLAKKTDTGLMTSEGLAQFYMTLLAEEIAFDKFGNPITDRLEYDNLTTYLRAKNPADEDLLLAAKTVVNLSMPSDIESLELQKFIEFRRDSGIVELRRSFNSSLNDFYKSVEDDFVPQDYLKHIGSINKAFVNEIGLFFGRIAASTLGGLILIKSMQTLAAVKQMIEGSTLAVSGTVSVNKAWSSGREKRHARKFLCKLRNMD